MWPGPRAASSSDQVTGLLVRAQHGEREAELVVVGALRRDGRAEPLHQLRESGPWSRSCPTNRSRRPRRSSLAAAGPITAAGQLGQRAGTSSTRSPGAPRPGGCRASPPRRRRRRGGVVVPVDPLPDAAPRTGRRAHPRESIDHRPVTTAAGSASPASRAPVIPAISASESGIKVPPLGRAALGAAPQRLRGDLAVVEGQHGALTYWPRLVALACDQHRVALPAVAMPG